MEIITYDIQLQVKVRKHKVDIWGVQTLLKNHKCYTNKQIAKQLKIPITQVEHYFRRDKYFAVPEPSIWHELKQLLSITDDSFDKQIMEFEIVPNQFDMGNRLYDSKGLCPTLLADCNNKLVLVKNNENQKNN